MDGECPVCGRAFDSRSIHEGGLMVNLRENERYRRVCLDPAACDETPVIEFYHHTHDQTTLESEPSAPDQTT